MRRRTAFRHLAALALTALVAACASPAPPPPPPPAPVAALPPPPPLLERRGPSLAELADGARDFRASVFGSVETPVTATNGDTKLIAQWDRVRNWRQARQQMACARGRPDCAPPANREYRAILAATTGLTIDALLRLVNVEVNRTPYRLDQEVFGQSDYWAVPDEFLGLAGDCEDFAIAKYMLLRDLGFAAESLRIVVLTDTIRNSIHAVLAVTVAGQTLILDCLSDEIFEDTLYRQYVPHFSVSEAGRYAHYGRTPVPFAGATLGAVPVPRRNSGPGAG